MFSHKLPPERPSSKLRAKWLLGIPWTDWWGLSGVGAGRWTGKHWCPTHLAGSVGCPEAVVSRQGGRGTLKSLLKCVETSVIIISFYFRKM